MNSPKVQNVMKSGSFLLIISFFVHRWKLLQVGLDEQYKKLNEIRRRGEVPTNQDFLSVAVHYPWARAISQNKVPYYINHQTETTHWDHPDMVQLFKNITEFNKVSWFPNEVQSAFSLQVRAVFYLELKPTLLRAGLKVVFKAMKKPLLKTKRFRISNIH